MKPFTKRLALVTGLLFTALICMGIVYIDTVQNYWYVNGGFVKLIVSNQTAQAVMTVDTNTQAVGLFTNEILRSFQVAGRRVATNATGNGTTANPFGLIQFTGSDGGHSSAAVAPTTSGGLAGGVTLRGGVGGNANNATTNALGGNGGAILIQSGAGGVGQSSAGVATNQITGGSGGAINYTSGAGGIPAAAATNTVGGSGGVMAFTAGAGATPSAGWSRLGGTAGGMTFVSGNGGSGTRTNGGGGGSVSMSAGNGGAVLTGPGDGGVPGDLSFTAGSANTVTGTGNPQPGGGINLNAGAGSTGTTNSDGGHVFIAGGAPGTGAVPGNAVVGRTSAGAARGGLQVGPLVAGTTGTMTNLLSVAAVLDFPSIVAGTVADLPVAFAGAADGDVVTLGVPLASVTNCTWMAFASNAVVYVRAANGQLVTAQDPNSGTFRIVLQKYR